MRSTFARWLLALTVTVALAACSDDDDGGDVSLPTDQPPATTTGHPETTVETTAATTPSTNATTTAAPTTPTTVVDLEALKAQIAADYVAAAAGRRPLTLNPSLDDLEARAAVVAAPGSVDYNGLVALVQDLVAKGERVVPGDPPFDETTVELVEIAEPSATTATVTACLVFNEVRVGADGIPVGDTGVLRGARVTQQVEATQRGWLPASAITVVAADSGVSECPES